MRIPRCWIVALAMGLAACGGDDGGATDPGLRDAGRDAVAAADPGFTDLAAPDVAALDLAVPDPAAGTDPAAPDPGTLPDTGDDPEAVDDPGSLPDPGSPDPGDATDPDAPPPADFCRSFDDCADDEVCVFSQGLCQKRATWVDSALQVLAFHPAAAAPGDLLVIDGRRFFAGGLGIGLGGIKVRVGNATVTTTLADENRLLVPVTAGMSGAVTVWDTEKHVSMLPVSFHQAPAGVIPCDGTTPLATSEPGKAPGEVGPFAAGYVDLNDGRYTRVFYPAYCGSIRRPPVPGTYPVIALLHGNGALHMNYEYLGELLATWGFVSFMPATDQNMAGDPFQDMLDKLMPLVTQMRGSPDLAGVHPVLGGVATTADIGFVGHSRGTGRTEEVIGSDPDIAAHTVGAVFLGPVDDGNPPPGLFMVFGGGKDSQSGKLTYAPTYSNHPAPRWMIELPGGNHGSFGDHKVYGYGGGILGALGDQPPTITRHRQLSVVQRFALPLFQRAFGLAEPFAAQLDSPPTAADYKVTYQLQ